MHKPQIRPRFIIVSKQCVIKPLSKNITAAFKLLYKPVGNYHNRSKFYSEINSFWATQNNKRVIDTLHKLYN